MIVWKCYLLFVLQVLLCSLFWLLSLDKFLLFLLTAFVSLTSEFLQPIYNLWLKVYFNWYLPNLLNTEYLTHSEVAYVKKKVHEEL